MSRTILSALNRSLLVPHLYTSQFNGTGTQELVLPEWPILPLPALTLNVSGTSILVAPQDSDQNIATNPFGFRFPPWDGVPPGNPSVLELVGTRYFFGNQNVVVTYNAGYQVSNEEAIVPATPFQVAPLTPYGIWATDEGVTYSATGVALTPITSGTPTVGQYLPPGPNATVPRMNYLFSGADMGEELLLNYGFIPFDVEQVCLDLIGERSAYRGRMGIRSQSLAGQETISYDTAGMTTYIRRVLEPYVSVIPPNLGANT